MLPALLCGSSLLVPLQVTARFLTTKVQHMTLAMLRLVMCWLISRLVLHFGTGSNAMDLKMVVTQLSYHQLGFHAVGIRVLATGLVLEYGYAQICDTIIWTCMRLAFTCWQHGGDKTGNHRIGECPHATRYRILQF